MGLKAERPGEIVQIDTLFVNVAPGKVIKHFTAYDTVAKWTCGAGRTTATTPARLLNKLIAKGPFALQAQEPAPAKAKGDGGSEIKATFEQACKDKELVL